MFAACSILRMLEHIVSPGTFIKGVRVYLEDRKFDDATEYDLWNAMQKALREDSKHLPFPVRKMMRAWTQCPGYPVISVSRTEEGKIELFQVWKKNRRIASQKKRSEYCILREIRPAFISG